MIDLGVENKEEIKTVVRAVHSQAKIAANTRRPLEERLLAYEDIIDSEIGDTSLVRARNIERDVGLRQIYLKFEGGNPSGTQKDRIAFAQVLDAMRRGFDTISVATCGSYGVAASLAASMAGLKCVVYIPAAYHSNRVQEMTNLGAEIRRVPGDYEQAVVVSKEYCEKEEVYDANPGSENISLQLNGYGQIANEIYDELRDAPAVVAVPVSNGTTLAGIYKGFLSLYRRGKTSRMPRMVAGSSFKKNPIVYAYLNGYMECVDLEPRKIRGTKINEALINWHSIDGDYALDAIHKTRGWAAYASDKQLTNIAKLLREREGLSIFPAATAGLIALIDKHKTEDLDSDRYVIILTGRDS